MTKRWHGREKDATDFLCIEEWAPTSRSIFGVRLDRMLESHERIGHLRGTLASIREEGEGAAYSQVSQRWAEVYTPMGMLIHRCHLTMPWNWRDAMMLEYVYDLDQWPYAKRVRDYGNTIHLHAQTVSDLKIYLNGFIAGTPLPDDDAIYAQSARR